MADIKGYKDIRHSPYGYGPASVLALIAFFQIFETQAFAVAQPDIVHDLRIKINSLIALQQYIGIVVLFLTIYAGWYLDRHPGHPGSASRPSSPASSAWSIPRAGRVRGIATPRIIDDTGDDDRRRPFLLAAGRLLPARGPGARSSAFLATMNRVARSPPSASWAYS